MSKNSMNRRHMLRIGSITALSGILSPSLAVAHKKRQNSKTLHIDMPASDSDLCYMNAVDMAALLRTKKISAREVMTAHLKQISKINPAVNAFVTMVPENELMSKALAADELLAKGNPGGPLHGMPIAVKDLTETKGIKTTFGSPIWKNFIPAYDALIVEREKAAGAIILGKTNVPELGLGSQTFNPLFGPSFNPYDITKTCGGSTGGGAVALACGMTPLADGSDMGGSLRNPASFCNVVGIRPSPGMVPIVTSKMAWQDLSVQGPVGRTVSDCAFLLSVQSGPDNRSPISIMESPQAFREPLQRNFKGVKIAFIKDMGLPWEPEVKEAVDAQRRTFESLGCAVDEDEPDMTDANECFVNFRHWLVEANYGDLLAEKNDQLNEYTKWHISEGRKLTGTYLSRLEMKRTALYRRFQKFLEKYEFLILPVSQVLPFDVKTPYPTEINGVKMLTYLDWMRSAYYISILGNPALSVPCAFSKSGLPIGMQIVGRHNADLSVLQLGFEFEQGTNIGKRRPGLVEQ
ncbi:MAG: amidase [Chitinophagales bacterium]